MLVQCLVFCAAVIALIGGTLWINSIVVFNTVRYMATAPSVLWRDPSYIRTLPNILKRLYDLGYSSPWPARPTALAAFVFRRKLRRILHDFPDSPRLIQQHLGLWAFVQFHRSDLAESIRILQIRRARCLLADSKDLHARAKVLAFLQGCIKSQPRTSCIPPAPAGTCDCVPCLGRLKSLNILFAEHGYSICPELALLSRWENADDQALIDELPLLNS